MMNTEFPQSYFSNFRTTVLVNLKNLKENYTEIKKFMAPLEVFAVIKADAYGMGAEKVAETLLEADVDGFAVSSLAEALPLLKYGKEIHILGAIFDFELETGIKNNLILTVPDEETAKRISKCALRLNKCAQCHIKLDTGMGRFGLTQEEALETIPRILQYPNIHCCGIFSHLPSAGEGEGEEAAENRKQKEKFLHVIEEMKKKDITFSRIHFSNSPGMNNCSFVRKEPFTRARIGLCLHGLYDDGARSVPLKNVMELHSMLASVRMMKKGSFLGYSRTCRLEEDTLVGLVAAGYADGVPLALSNKGYVLFRGKRCRILGRIAMDYTTISLQEFAGEKESLSIGEKVVLLGKSGEEEITVYDWAELKKTHPYEILCSITKRAKRKYTE